MVGDVDGHGLAVVGDENLAATRAGVADHVGDRFLDDPVGGQLEITAVHTPGGTRPSRARLSWGRLSWASGVLADIRPC